LIFLPGFESPKDIVHYFFSKNQLEKSFLLDQIAVEKKKLSLKIILYSEVNRKIKNQKSVIF